MPIDAAELLKALARSGQPIPDGLGDPDAPTLRPVKRARTFGTTGPTAAQDGRTARPVTYLTAYAASRFAAAWNVLGVVLYVVGGALYRLGRVLWRAMRWAWRAIRSTRKEGTR